MFPETRGNEKSPLKSWIGLSQEKLREALYYDGETGIFTRRSNGKKAGTLNSNGYINIYIYGRQRAAHVLAWLYVHGELTMVDHDNCIRHDNRIKNLRRTTYQLNAANRSYIPNNSGMKGVYYRNGKYEAGIKVNGKRIYLGRFENEDDAAEAYRLAAIEHFGEFANVY